MDYPWKGAARPRSPDAFARTAKVLECTEEELMAVWEVEAAGAPFRPDGTLTRRFEPHKVPGATMAWRESLKLPEAERERLFIETWNTNPRAALEATSWGAPQIMGFNYAAAGYSSAEDMVRAMADSEDAQLEAFAAFVRSAGLASALRAHDWKAFAAGYNGRGQPDVYAKRIEAAYRRASGRKSPGVLRLGDTGPAVRELQRALGIRDDGIFGPETQSAVQEFQRAHGLVVDGVVGARTWAALVTASKAKPRAQPVSFDEGLARIQKISGLAAGVAAASEALQRTLPSTAYGVGVWVLVGMVLITAVTFWARWMRSQVKEV